MIERAFARPRPIKGFTTAARRPARGSGGQALGGAAAHEVPLAAVVVQDGAVVPYKEDIAGAAAPDRIEGVALRPGGLPAPAGRRAGARRGGRPDGVAGGGRVVRLVRLRDDLTAVSDHPILRETLIDFNINNLSLVLVDDVLYTGRTIRSALDGIMDLGRPRRIQLAVLIDRGGRELPIQADYVGKRISVAEDETVEVRLNEEDNEERVVLLRNTGRKPVAE